MRDFARGGRKFAAFGLVVFVDDAHEAVDGDGAARDLEHRGADLRLVTARASGALVGREAGEPRMGPGRGERIRAIDGGDASGEVGDDAARREGRVGRPFG
ncbi:MAG TPA: hypothetical protein VIK91_25470 [Nannocystis sp.]